MVPENNPAILVDVGTTNPGATLNVVPTSTSIAGLFSGTTSSDMVRITQLGSGNALVVEDSANPDASPFVVNASGSVGIGTTNPQDTLDVGLGTIRLYNKSVPSRFSQIYQDGALTFKNSAVGDDFQFLASSNSLMVLKGSGPLILPGTASLTGTSSQLLQVTGGAYVSGNLGIGTTNPRGKLDVVGLTTTTDLYVAGVGTFLSSGLKIRNPANTFEYAITGGAIVADRTLNLPVITGTDTLAVLGLSQTFSAAQTFSSTLTHSATTANFTATSYTTGTVTIGGALQTGLITFGRSTASQQIDIQAGASGVGTTKTINFGTGGLSGSFTNINIGPTAGIGTVLINSGTNLGINSTTPTSKLDVVGDAKVSGVVTATTFVGQINAGVSTLGVTSATNLTAQQLNVSGITTVGFITATNIWNAGITTSSRITLNGANDTTQNGGQIFLNGATGNRIDFNTNGVAIPSTGARSVGTKIVLYPGVGGSTVDYGLGIESATLWYSVPSATNVHTHRWYGSTTQLADLKGSGELVIGSSSLTGTASQRLQVTGGAYVSGNTGIGTTNPQAPLQVEELGFDTTLTTTTSTSQVAVDTFATTTFRSAKYHAQITCPGQISTLGGITTGGRGYTAGTYNVTFTTSSGNGSAAQGTLVVSNGTVGQISVSAGGTGYTAGDVLTASGGSGLQVSVGTTDGTGAILTLGSITSAGIGYTAGVGVGTTSLTFLGGTGFNATGLATIFDGVITSSTLLQQPITGTGGTVYYSGSNYSTASVLSVDRTTLTNTITTITGSVGVSTFTSLTTHGLFVNDIIRSSSSSNGLTAGTDYYVVTTPTTTTFTLGTSLGVGITFTAGTSLSIGFYRNSANAGGQVAYTNAITGVSTNHQVSDLMVLQNGTTADFIEYATIANNDILGTFSADISGANTRLLFTPTYPNNTIKVARQAITI